MSAAAGAAYHDKLLRLPGFFSHEIPPASADELADAFALTGFFLDRYAFAPRGLPVPDARERFISAVLVPQPLTALPLPAMNKKLIPPDPSNVQEIALREALEERYLAYALSTIMHRALPDARDGLKPVHRRLLYGMQLLAARPGGRLRRNPRAVVGDVIGKFHPHGDQAVYDALVRLAQDFAQRYPLIDGQGNFGNVDGDNPAADALHRGPPHRGGAAPGSMASAKTPSISAPSYYGAEAGAGGPAGGVPEFARQWFRRALRSAWRRRSRRIISPSRARAALYLIDTPNARSRTLSNSFRHRTSRPAAWSSIRRDHCRGLCDRPGVVPAAGALDNRRYRPRHLPCGRHRDPLAGSKEAAGRATSPS